MKKHRGEKNFLDQALRILMKVCEAMAYAHSRKVVHRDLKPTNIAISQFGEVWIMDWRLAKVLSSSRETTQKEDTSPEIPFLQGKDLTLSGSILGTPGYMSPQQALGEEPDTRDDIYAIGAILYETLTGAPPFSDTQDVFTRILKCTEEDPLPLHLLDPKIPRELSSIAMKCMAHSRKDRYQSCQNPVQD